jgi:hypothetical protein
MDDEVVGRSCSDRAAARVFADLGRLSSRLFVRKKRCCCSLVLVSEKLSIVGYDLKKDHTQCMVLWSTSKCDVSQ